MDYFTAKQDKDKLRYDLIPMDILLENLSSKVVDQSINPTGYYEDYQSLLNLCTIALGGINNLTRELAKVYTYGCTKYGEESWKTVPDGLKRYKAAIYRHLDRFFAGEYVNYEDGGLLHISQVAWNVLAVLYLEGKSEPRK